MSLEIAQWQLTRDSEFAEEKKITYEHEHEPNVRVRNLQNLQMSNRTRTLSPYITRLFGLFSQELASELVSITKNLELFSTCRWSRFKDEPEVPTAADMSWGNYIGMSLNFSCSRVNLKGPSLYYSIRKISKVLNELISWMRSAKLLKFLILYLVNCCLLRRIAGSRLEKPASGRDVSNWGPGATTSELQ